MIEDIIKQQCKQCGEIYPLTSEFFVRCRIMKNGFRIICKSCLHKQKYEAYHNCPKEIRRQRQHAAYIRYSEIRKKNAKIYRDDPNNHIRLMEKAKLRRQTKPEIKIGIYGRNRINELLKSKKSLKFNEFLGCSPVELKIYLESKFKPGMSWDNWKLKGWHIDHIIPCSSFDLTNIEQQKKCFHYTNLQPLWWYENLSKHNKITNGEVLTQN